MDKKLHYNVKDVLWSPIRALSAKKIAVMTFFLLVALAVYNIFTYIAFAIDKDKISTIFNVYAFFPFYKAIFDNFIAQIIFAVGAVGSVFILMLGFFGVSSLEIESIRGNRFMSPFQALLFSLKRFKQIFLAELGMICFLGFILLLFIIFGIIARIPFIGEWIYTILFVLPNFIVAVLTVFIFTVLLISIILLPAVSSAEQKGEAFQSILETFATIIRQPFRWSGYTILTLATAKVGSFVYAYLCYRSVQFIAWATSIGGGEKMKTLVKSSMSLLPIKSDLARETFNVFPGIDFGFSLVKYSKFIDQSAVSYLMAFMIFIIFASIIGYFLTVLAVGQARGYAVIRYLKDGYKIEDEKPSFAAKPVDVTNE